MITRALRSTSIHAFASPKLVFPVTRRPVVLPNAFASSSTAHRPLSTGLPSRPWGPKDDLRLPVCVGKGKARCDTPSISQQHIYTAPTKRSHVRLVHRRPEVISCSVLPAIRLFHATPRRDALPLIPGVAALLKTTSLLTAATALSRILISFFPIGTLATMRLARGVTWLSKDTSVPKTSPEAEEFWKMWCEDEKGIRITKEQALALIDAPKVENDGLLGPDGRIAYCMPLPKNIRRSIRENENLSDEDKKSSRWISHRARTIRGTHFYLPDLPAVSIRYFNELEPTQRAEVDARRRHWVSLKVFKDRLSIARWCVALIVGLPIFLLLVVWVTGLERVPLTGRWRFILLTPEEEDAISSSLAGSNWYKSVINLLTSPERPAPPIVPLDDWRWGWVQSTLRRLEAGAIREVESVEHGDSPLPTHSGTILPPPASYPLKPRPRASARLHAVLPGGEAGTGTEHLELGPPYSLMIMEADEKNAFSYGFGGKGAGGIVIFTGLLDDILKSHNTVPPVPPPSPPSRGLLSGLFSIQNRSVAVIPQPTEEQTLHLATIIAHEMGHLLLSHHLETLSQQQVLWPSVLGLSMDLIRAFIWPFTIFLGPTVNDALANVGRASAEEMADRYGHIGFEWRHEFEADLTGLRLLAYSGFDPRAAVDQFAESIASLEEIQPDSVPWWTLFKLWTWATHPSADARVEGMRSELERWVREASTTKTSASAST